MFLRSLVLVKASPATHASSSPSPSRHLEARAPVPWSHAAVVAELTALTRLFKRLMRSRSARTTTTPWQTTVATVRHVMPSSAERTQSTARESTARASFARPVGTNTAERVPVVHRRGVAMRRFSPVCLDQSLTRFDHNRAPCGEFNPRVHADPIDPQRVMISGSFAEVCAALDHLVARQEALASPT